MPTENKDAQPLKIERSTVTKLVITSGAQPVLKLCWVGEEVQREDIAQEFKTVLQDRIGSAAALSLEAFDPKYIQQVGKPASLRLQRSMRLSHQLDQTRYLRVRPLSD